MNEIEAAEQAKLAMGEALATPYVALNRNLIELHIVWLQYRQLFGSSSDTIELLNKTAGLFFMVVQDQLWDSVLLGIARLTDNAKTFGKSNLTIWSLPPLIDDIDLRQKVSSLCEQARDCAAFARNHRNKRIAHSDYSYEIDRAATALDPISRAAIKEMLDALEKVLNCIRNSYLKSCMHYASFVDKTGATSLLYRLKELEDRRHAPGAPSYAEILLAKFPSHP